MASVRTIVQEVALAQVIKRAKTPALTVIDVHQPINPDTRYYKRRR
jgi:hypothetical protein